MRSFVMVFDQLGHRSGAAQHSPQWPGRLTDLNPSLRNVHITAPKMMYGDAVNP